VQVVADTAGTVWTLGVRDCSVQRRNQKVIEESASTALDTEQEKLLRSHAAELVRAAGCVNAGTVEFLYEPSQRLLSFLEVNTRLQVEHPVTEATTGVDIVKLQLHIAAGGTLAGIGPAEPPARGHAIEARLTAEDPEGMRRVVLLGDPVRALGALAEPECRRVLAAIELARLLHAPVEWFAISAGAKIAMNSGTETMDWISRALRGIIEFTQDAGEINVVVTGINVGAQPYWNAEATMLMHTRGVLIMTPDSAMVLTGKQSLDYSGGVSAEGNFGIGRAREVGSVHVIVPAARLRPYLIGAVQRGMARTLAGGG